MGDKNGIMENELEIFVAWLIKFIKNDKRITGKELALRIGCDPTTISSYIRRRTKPDFDTRIAILNAVGVPYEDMMREGRIKLGNFVTATTPPVTMTAQATTTPAPPRQKTDIEIQLNKNHQEIVGRFEFKELAIEINRTLLEIEKIGGRDEMIKAQGAMEERLRELIKKKGDAGKTGTMGE